MFILIGIFQVIILILYIKYFVKDNNPPISIISKIALFAFLISVIKYVSINYFVNPGYPNSTFLFNPDDRFGDFVNMIDACKSLDPYNLQNKLPSVYFPLSNLFFYLVFVICKMDISTSILFFIAIFLVLLFIMLKSNVRGTNKQTFFFLLALLLSYPVLFSLDRLNLELYLFIFIFLFIYFYNKNQYTIAVLFLSFAICMKLYPILFLAIFLKKKEYKPIIYATLFSFFFTFTSLSLFKGGVIININQLLFNLNDFNKDYEGLSGIQHNSSLYGIIKIIMLTIYKYLFNFDKKALNDIVNSTLKVPYLFLVFIYFSFLTTYIIFIEKKLWKNIFLIISMIILLPHVSFDYKLLYVIISIVLFLENAHLEKKSTIYAILFALLIIPNSYFYFISDVSVGVIINPILIMIITSLIIHENKQNIGIEIRKLQLYIMNKLTKSNSN